jgi:hypothetical protein
MIKKLYRQFDAWMDYNPPGALSSKGWRLFNKEFREKAPIRFWVRKSFRHFLLYPISRTNSRIYSWFSYRLFNRYHKVDTGLKPGYYEIDTRILNVNFNLLKDFVECELAWSKIIHEDDRPWYERFRIVRMFKRSRFRRPDLGLEYLEWASKLDDPSLPPFERSDRQAIAARETRELYDWWVNKRPNRKKIEVPHYTDQGLGDLSVLDEEFDHSAEDYKKTKEAMDAQSELDEQWKNEDDEMLIRLIKIRHDLWT